MATPHIAALWFLPFVFPVAIYVAWHDLKTMRIPNWSFLALLGIFLAVGPFVLPLEDWGWRWLHVVVMLVITFVLSLTGQMGAGDAKYLSAMSPFIALQDAGWFMVLLALTSLVALILKWVLGMIPAVRRVTGEWESYKRSRVFPYGLALSLSFLLYLVACL